jgi:hypothetical protein
MHAVSTKSATRKDALDELQYRLFQQAAIARMLGRMLEHVEDCDESDRAWFEESREGLAAVARNLATVCSEAAEAVGKAVPR